MGLLDDVLANALGGGSGGSQGNSLVKGVIDMLGDPNHGLSGLSQSFQSQGLGHVLSSWIGTGENQAISSDQLTNVLGTGRVEELAKRAGVSSAQAPGILAAVLPAIINQLTPDGQVPQRALLADRGKGLLDSIGSALGASKASAQPAPRPKADFSDVQSGSSSTAPEPGKPDQTYTVVAGDSLSKISKHFYGDANQWRRIFEANRDQIQNPDLIHPGQKLRIPEA